MLIDNLFDADVDELIAVCGDFNADLDGVPVEVIRSNVENYLCKGRLAKRVIMPIERIVQESDRF